MKNHVHAILLATVPLAACTAPSGLNQPSGVPSFYEPGPAVDSDPVAPRSAEEARPRVDWGVVEEPPPGVAEVGTQTHGVEPTEPGRLYILELYQSVLDERDALQLELASLSQELDQAHARIAELEEAELAASMRIEELESDNVLLREENADLAGRLTTAQIRRLEVEKLLLETRIAWQRESLEREEAAAGVTLRDPRADLGTNDGE